jgi:hypothetical protein
MFRADIAGYFPFDLVYLTAKHELLPFEDVTDSGVYFALHGGVLSFQIY